MTTRPKRGASARAGVRNPSRTRLRIAKWAGVLGLLSAAALTQVGCGNSDESGPCAKDQESCDDRECCTGLVYRQGHQCDADVGERTDCFCVQADESPFVCAEGDNFYPREVL